MSTQYTLSFWWIFTPFGKLFEHFRNNIEDIIETKIFEFFHCIWNTQVMSCMVYLIQITSGNSSTMIVDRIISKSKHLDSTS